MRLTQRVKTWLVEALGGTLLGDYTRVDDTELSGFRRLTDPEGRLRRDLDLVSYGDMVKMGHYLYASNPKARWLIDVRLNLIVGAEVGYSVAVDHRAAGMDEDEATEIVARVRKALDQFWEHPTHDIKARALEYATSLMVSGNIALPVAGINPVSGVPQLDMLDAAQISDVLSETGNVLVPDVMLVRSPTGGGRERRLSISRPDIEGRLPAEPRPGTEGTVLYFRHGRLLNQMRGVSDLMDVADWLDGQDQFLFAALDRAILRNGVVWDLTIEDESDPAKIDAEARKVTTAMSKPGSTYAHNQRTKLEAKSPALDGADTSEMARLYRVHILGSKGIPESWYSDGGQANKGTSTDQTDVAYKALLAYQTELRRMFRMLLHFGYDQIQARQGGAGGQNLPPRSVGWLTLEPELPAVSERDMVRQGSAFSQITAALGSAVDGDLLSTETAQRVVIDLVSKLGTPVTVDEERARIAAEREARDQKAADISNQMARSRVGQALAEPDPEDTADPADPEDDQGSDMPKKGQQAA